MRGGYDRPVRSTADNAAPDAPIKARRRVRGAAGGRRVTMTDIAREAGCSQATVSFVLNRTAGIKISQQTRDKVIEAARANTNAAFDFATQIMTVKSLSEMVELSTAHTRKQFETFTGQSKELAAIAQKVATESVEPVKESWGKAFKKIP